MKSINLTATDRTESSRIDSDRVSCNTREPMPLGDKLLTERETCDALANAAMAAGAVLNRAKYTLASLVENKDVLERAAEAGVGDSLESILQETIEHAPDLPAISNPLLEILEAYSAKKPDEVISLSESWADKGASPEGLIKLLKSFANGDDITIATKATRVILKRAKYTLASLVENKDVLERAVKAGVEYFLESIVHKTIGPVPGFPAISNILHEILEAYSTERLDEVIRLSEAGWADKGASSKATEEFIKLLESFENDDDKGIIIAEAVGVMLKLSAYFSLTFFVENKDVLDKDALDKDVLERAVKARVEYFLESILQKTIKHVPDLPDISNTLREILEAYSTEKLDEVIKLSEDGWAGKGTNSEAREEELIKLLESFANGDDNGIITAIEAAGVILELSGYSTLASLVENKDVLERAAKAGVEYSLKSILQKTIEHAPPDLPDISNILRKMLEAYSAEKFDEMLRLSESW